VKVLRLARAAVSIAEGMFVLFGRNWLIAWRAERGLQPAGVSPKSRLWVAHGLLAIFFGCAQIALVFA
jgi:hypothetical protein